MSSDRKKPTHRVYFIKGEGDAADWIELGAQWEHKDGKGFDIILKTLPVGGFNGRLVARVIEAKKEDGGETTGQSERT